MTENPATASETVRTEKRRANYRRMTRELGDLLAGNLDPVAAMATCASVLHQGIPEASWTGFYRVVGAELLRVGPYQGPVGCLEIPFGRGVCGTVARERRTMVIDDVHAFTDHIACDPAARSEIVVPVTSLEDELVAVLDIDSHRPSAFDDIDRQELERMVETLRPYLT